MTNFMQIPNSIWTYMTNDAVSEGIQHIFDKGRTLEIKGNTTWEDIERLHQAFSAAYHTSYELYKFYRVLSDAVWVRAVKDTFDIKHKLEERLPTALDDFPSLDNVWDYGLYRIFLINNNKVEVYTYVTIDKNEIWFGVSLEGLQKAKKNLFSKEKPMANVEFDEEHEYLACKMTIDKKAKGLELDLSPALQFANEVFRTVKGA